MTEILTALIASIAFGLGVSLSFLGSLITWNVLYRDKYNSLLLLAQSSLFLSVGMITLLSISILRRIPYLNNYPIQNTIL